MLRALRNTWPGVVSHIAILRNTEDNPTLSAERMAIFDETFEPSVPVELDGAALLASEASKQPPTAKGGFVVRITNPAGEVTHVPLRGVPENTLEAADAWRLTNPEGLPQDDDDDLEDPGRRLRVVALAVAGLLTAGAAVAVYDRQHPLRPIETLDKR